MTIIAATHNAHKLVEFRSILEPEGVTVLSLADVSIDNTDIDETGATFLENAMIKAQTIAALSGQLVMSDDSGLEVTALNGEPGIYSARYAGPDATDKDRMQKVLDGIAESPDRSARFVCVIALAGPEGEVGSAEGEIRGRIAPAPRGENGFGYDPIFVPTGEQRTFAEMSSAEKDSMSHRKNALARALEQKLFSV
jgi:XTP/dITP diphosphohydrolase